MATARLDINFFDRSVIEDPFPHYEAVRAAGRVVWNDLLHAWMVPGFDDCQSVLTDPARFSNAMYRDPQKVWWFEAPNMVMADPPEHQRLRNPLSPMFLRSAVARWEPRVAAVVDELLAPLVAGSEDFDIIRDFTMIPTVVLAEMIGVPKERHEDFRRWSSTIAGSVTYGLEPDEVRTRMSQAADELKVYLDEEFDRHRREQPDDLLTAMLALPPDVGMSDAELRSSISVLLLAGYDTTAKLMSNFLVVLEQHPEQRRVIAADPTLVPAAVEEVLRWCGVLHGVIRTTEHDTEVGGTPIAKGELVCTLPAAGNRDPARFEDPMRFDVRRDPKSHLGFGYGPHLCIGAPLARLETKVVIERLLRLAPGYRLRDVDYGHAWFIRGPERGILDVGMPTARLVREGERVGYVDCDAHVYESEATWEHLDPKEREFRPLTVGNPDARFEQWLVGGQLVTRGDRFHPMDDTRSHALHAPGTTSLADVPGRLAHMDRLGVNVQVIFSTFFIGSNLPRPLVEAALARSWNRWMAEKHEESKGRLRWALRAPLRMMDHALEEMEFGKAHGAVGVHLQGQVAGMVLDDEYLDPLYAKAQDLDLVMCVHVGLDVPGYFLPDRRYGFSVVTAVPLGFHRLCVSDLDTPFPRLRWAWLEAGASWIPFVLVEAARAKGGLMTRSEGETRVDRDLLARKRLYVARQIDDDIPYLATYAGGDNLVMGTDYGHIDIGSDLEAGAIIAKRDDLDPVVRRKIVDENARTLYGIDRVFTPSERAKGPVA